MDVLSDVNVWRLIVVILYKRPNKFCNYFEKVVKKFLRKFPLLLETKTGVKRFYTASPPFVVFGSGWPINVNTEYIVLREGRKYRPRWTVFPVTRDLGLTSCLTLGRTFSSYLVFMSVSLFCKVGWILFKFMTPVSRGSCEWLSNVLFGLVTYIFHWFLLLDPSCCFSLCLPFFIYLRLLGTPLG